MKNFLFDFEVAANCLFCENKWLDLDTRTLPYSKEKKKCEKKLVESEFVETCHVQVTSSLISRFIVFARSTMEIANSGKNSAVMEIF